MPTEDAYSSGHLILSHFGACKYSNVETNISWTCLVSGLLSFEHPSVLLFLLSISECYFFISTILASRFNLTYRYIHDVLSINNPEFDHDLGQMYSAELEIKDTTERMTSASYLDLLLSIGRDGQLHTSIYDKRDDFNFYITNFPFLNSNIPSSPAYGVFISQLIRYARTYSSYEWGPGEFTVSYSNRDTSWNAWNRHSGSFMVNMGILFSNMEYPSHEC